MPSPAKRAPAWRRWPALLVLAGIAVAGCGSSSSSAGTDDDGAQPDIASGKEIFQAKCGLCHELADAGTPGTLGPNLDQLRPSAARTLRQIDTGGGAMPADLVEGQDAQDVAAYVAEVAGETTDADAESDG